jgi:hypothetical protein
MEVQNQQEIKNKIAEFEAKYGIKLDANVIKEASKNFQKTDPITWSMTHRNLKGEPYRFELPTDKRGNSKLWKNHRPFLKQFISDQAQYKCSQKSRQSGMSESSVTEAGWFLAEHQSTRVVYTFPSGKQMNDFSNGRIDPLFDESEYLRSLKGDVFNVGMKQVGKNSFLYLRSASTGRLGEGIDADAVYFDEKDRMVDGVEDAFRQSLSASSYGLLREFSTPTLPGRGINKSFKKSCQYYWFVQCESGHRQTLTYPENIGFNFDIDPTTEYIVPGTCFYKCSHVGVDGVPCISKINRWDGEWVAKENIHIKDRVGYHINQLSCQWIDADRIVQEKITMKWPDLFYNYVLGEVYASNDGLISEDALRACLDRTRRSIPHVRRAEYTQIVAGIDWGSLNWCIVLGRRLDGIYEVCGFKYVQDSPEILHSAKEIADYLEPFRPNLIVADLGYGVDRCQYLLKRFPERVFACTYTNTANNKMFMPVWTTDRVSVNRTAHLRNMLETIKMKKILFPGQEEEYKIIFKHIMSLVLVHQEEEDPDKEDSVVIEKIDHTGPDHCAHALAYGCLAAEKLHSGGAFAWSFI